MAGQGLLGLQVSSCRATRAAMEAKVVDLQVECGCLLGFGIDSVWRTRLCPVSQLPVCASEVLRCSQLPTPTAHPALGELGT